MLKPTKILSPRQIKFLDLFNNSPLTPSFYLSGGTALCGFYLPYRKSEDLDFFSQIEFEISSVINWLKLVKSELKFTSFDIQTAFNRNLVFLEFGRDILKTEFTNFPFPSTKQLKYKNITVDSLIDIALNKLFTIYQNPRLRDFMDLYMIMENKGYNLESLRMGAKAKFDWDIDPIQLGSQLLKVTEKKDRPILVEEFDFTLMEKFYEKLALSINDEIFQ